MKNRLAKAFIIGFIASLLIGCNKQATTSESTSEAEVVENKYIVRNGHSEYRIVIPTNANAKVQLAANELSSYLKKSTGSYLPILTENEVTSGTNYISLGATSLFNAEFAETSLDQLKEMISSYFISTRDDNIYIYSNPNERGEGVLYGAYDLLHELIGYEYYARDEIYFSKQDTINLRQYDDVVVEPSFDGRAVGNLYLTNNQDVCDHLRLHNIYRGKEWASGLYGHGQVITFVRPQDIWSGSTTLIEAHPEWFSNKSAQTADTTNNQLCWSAGEELEQYVAKRFTHFFQEYPDATYFMFGQEDNNTSFCKCEKCMHAMEHEAVNYAGLQIMFMNKVIKMTNAWLEENQPGRHVRYVVYAYYSTANAPCVQVEGKWVAANDQVIPHEDLFIFYAPITCNFAYPLDNNYFNSDILLQLKQWNEVAAGHVIMYLYDVNFRYYFANYANFATVKSMYKTCRDLGAVYMYTQGAMDSVTACFTDMRQYVESKLMWNVNDSYQRLAKDFIDHYYYEAAPEINEFYETVRDRLMEYHANRGDGGAIYTNIANKTLYPYSVLRYYTSLFDKAMEKIEHYQEDDPQFYDILKARIMKEYLSVIYLKITLAKSELSDEEKEEMKEIFSYYVGYFGITKTVEGGSLIDIDSMFN